MGHSEEGEQLQPGDLVVVKSHHVGDHGRTGEIVEVLGEPGHEHFRLRWEDGHESIFFPSSDAVVERISRVSQ